MWAFLSARLRAWLLVAVIAPVLGWLLGKLGDLLEARRGPSALTRTLHAGRYWLGRRSRRRERTSRAAADPIGPSDAGAPAR